MIALNTYSFAIRMGLLKNKEKNWSFEDFLKFCKKKKIKKIEFPIDYFAKKEKKKFEFFFDLLKKYNLDSVLALENFEINHLQKLYQISKKNPFDIVRIKMSNFFGGNRYKQKKFNKVKKNFIIKLQKSVKTLNKANFKIAIENHQDLSSFELVKIIKSLKSKNIGITWDIGNSLATCETPDHFFHNSKKYILSAHCKNYKIILSEKGFFLKRSIINEGSINIKKYIKFFKRKKINISLELAAHVNRHCDLNETKFLNYHNVSTKKLQIFRSYLMKNSINESPFTDWELYKKINLSAKNELNDFNKSLIKLKNYE